MFSNQIMHVVTNKNKEVHVTCRIGFVPRYRNHVIYYHICRALSIQLDINLFYDVINLKKKNLK